MTRSYRRVVIDDIEIPAVSDDPMSFQRAEGAVFFWLFIFHDSLVKLNEFRDQAILFKMEFS